MLLLVTRVVLFRPTFSLAIISEVYPVEDPIFTPNSLLSFFIVSGTPLIILELAGRRSRVAVRDLL